MLCVERASCIKGCVKSITQLVVTLDPIAMVVFVFRSCWSNSVSLPQDPAVSGGRCVLPYLLLSSGLQCSGKPLHICDLHPRKAESLFHSKLYKTHFIVTGFLCDKPRYLCTCKILLLSFLPLPKSNIFQLRAIPPVSQIDLVFKSLQIKPLRILFPRLAFSL